MPITMNITKTDILELALDPDYAGPLLSKALAQTKYNQVALQGIRLLRHKIGRRALIAYELQCQQSGEDFTLLGKQRSKGTDRATYRLHQELAAVGFNAQASDGIMLPGAVAMIPELNMWLQQHVPGEIALAGLLGSEGLTIARRIAEAAHKLHCAGLVPRRSHSMSDELYILARRLDDLAEQLPHMAIRLGRVLHECRQLGLSVAKTPLCGIHRDFYFDQLLIDHERVYVLDLDLYSLGDPALDIGNFIAHLIEYGLRCYANPDALAGQGQALCERFLELNTEARPETVEVYTTLSLARHIAISHEFADRRHSTMALLELCERRLALTGRHAGRPLQPGPPP